MEDNSTTHDSIYNFNVVGYSLSATALFFAIALFCTMKSINCTRIQIHNNLMVAMFLDNSSWIIWFTKASSADFRSHMLCKMLHIITNYFMMASNFWALIEGVHLNFVFTEFMLNDDTHIIYYIIASWGSPCVLMGSYTVVRYIILEDTKKCWTDDSLSYLIIGIPIMVSVLLTTGFFIKFMIVLFKRHYSRNRKLSVAIMKTAQAAFIMIPLFGLHKLPFILHPAPYSSSKSVFNYIKTTINTFQSIAVPVVSCFISNDVVTEVHGYISHRARKRQAIAMIFNPGRNTHSNVCTSTV